MEKYINPQEFGGGMTDPENTPYIYLTGPWIYLVMLFIVGVIVINFTMCLCITCDRSTVPRVQKKTIYEEEEEQEQQMELNIYGQ
mmetsp:Transcript_58943/g.93770  ORF Transcript_58943/g.93770 Transcript_58943/m.93770 type:complete len:85 (-) Transcript_58943:84-338(-)